MYIQVKYKFFSSLILSLLWVAISIYLAIPWIYDLSQLTNIYISIFIIFGIAILPGFVNAFIIFSLLLDSRPKLKAIDEYPAITLLIAAYNESENIITTIESIYKQNYNGKITVIVVNDGSTDDTLLKIRSQLKKYSWLKVLTLYKNSGKAFCLNKGLALVETELFITIDADCILYRNALSNIVARYLSDPVNTAVVAGAVLVKNSRYNFITKMQEFDYFLGINAVKRIQSLFQGTLVAQGAFSIYNTKIIKSIGGWKNTVGEDIVLTWDILMKDYRVGFCEEAILFTNVPTTLSQFIKQRQRWSRGLIEAFKYNWKLLFRKKFITCLIWLNLFFPYLDIIYSLVFIPGIILAIFGYYFIAGPLTLILIPMAMLMNLIIFYKHKQTFNKLGLVVRKNIFGFISYMFLYSIILQPSAVIGYLKELLFFQKKWGTK